jgi:hypothetical protein
MDPTPFRTSAPTFRNEVGLGIEKLGPRLRFEVKDAPVFRSGLVGEGGRESFENEDASGWWDAFWEEVGGGLVCRLDEKTDGDDFRGAGDCVDWRRDGDEWFGDDERPLSPVGV